MTVHHREREREREEREERERIEKTERRERREERRFSKWLRPHFILAPLTAHARAGARAGARARPHVVLADEPVGKRFLQVRQPGPPGGRQKEGRQLRLFSITEILVFPLGLSHHMNHGPSAQRPTRNRAPERERGRERERLTKRERVGRERIDAS